MTTSSAKRGYRARSIRHSKAAKNTKLSKKVREGHKLIAAAYGKMGSGSK